MKITHAAMALSLVALLGACSADEQRTPPQTLKPVAERAPPAAKPKATEAPTKTTIAPMDPADPFHRSSANVDTAMHNLDEGVANYQDAYARLDDYVRFGRPEVIERAQMLKRSLPKPDAVRSLMAGSAWDRAEARKTLERALMDLKAMEQFDKGPAK